MEGKKERLYLQVIWSPGDSKSHDSLKSHAFTNTIVIYTIYLIFFYTHIIFQL